MESFFKQHKNKSRETEIIDPKGVNICDNVMQAHQFIRDELKKRSQDLKSRPQHMNGYAGRVFVKYVEAVSKIKKPISYQAACYAFSLAVMWNLEKHVKTFVENGLYANTPVMHWPFVDQDKSSAAPFNMALNMVHYPYTDPKHSMPALSAMIDIGCLSMAQVLLNLGANPNDRDCNGMTALHHICCYPMALQSADRSFKLSTAYTLKLRDLICDMMSHHVDLNAKDDLKRTPLMCLRANKSLDSALLGDLFYRAKDYVRYPVRIFKPIEKQQKNDRQRDS